jgi:hypothetical protein
VRVRDNTKRCCQAIGGNEIHGYDTGMVNANSTHAASKEQYVNAQF